MTTKPVLTEPAVKREETSEQISEIFAVSPQVPRRWAAAGCPHTRGTHKRKLFFDSPEVATWLQSTGRGTRGRPGEKSDALREARIRKETSLASRYEFELQHLQARRSTRGTAALLKANFVHFAAALIGIFGQHPDLPTDLAGAFADAHSRLYAHRDISWYGTPVAGTISLQVAETRIAAIYQLHGFMFRHLAEYAARLENRTSADIRTELERLLIEFGATADAALNAPESCHDKSFVAAVRAAAMGFDKEKNREET